MMPKPDEFPSSRWKRTAPARAIAAVMERLGVSRWRSSHSPRRTAPDSIATDEYRRWLNAYGSISAPTRTAMQASIPMLAARPLISVIMPVYNIELPWLRASIASVRQQIYPNFELCISDDASTLDGIRDFLKAQDLDDPRMQVTLRGHNGHIK